MLGQSDSRFVVTLLPIPEGVTVTSDYCNCKWTTLTALDPVKGEGAVRGGGVGARIVGVLKHRSIYSQYRSMDKLF